MTETTIKKVNTVSTTSPTVEVPTNQETKLVEKNECLKKDEGVCWDCKNKKPITLKGVTTSRIEQALKGSKTQGQSPYPARVFLKVDNQEEDIPIFFRIKENDEWTKPKIKKGSYLEIQGIFKDPDPQYNQDRPSFTAYSYQLLDPNLQGKFTLLQATQQLPELEQAYQQIKRTRRILESYE